MPPGRPREEAANRRSKYGKTYTFTNVINPADPTFNQELGINNGGVIAGYNGSGVPGHPNQGYTTTTTSIWYAPSPQRIFRDRRRPRSPASTTAEQRSVSIRPPTTGLTQTLDSGIKLPELFTAVSDPKTPANSTPAVNQLLGINDNGVAAGFYNDANGNSHGYTYNLNTGKFTPVVDPAAAAASLTATAIDNAGDVAGFFVNGAGMDSGFLDQGGTFTTIRASRLR